MRYEPIITKDMARGLCISRRNALAVLKRDKFNVHNIRVGGVLKVALCKEDTLVYIVSRRAYQEYITPKINFENE